ncbi:flagellar hook-associated protein FlgL [Candidatus Endoriftia persephone]|uniref:Flagellar hook-associated protein 3 n=3 Tax=Gammaproteobacteria TaxID=1236 RepID=G2FB50_9GAMM|nr:flagellar hook-associated protein FlgL [Candidatus Endoriftia persephone]EGV51079.1 flagellar hook-associated protein flgL [endosymbiont of Riftia pachyptila (vent Ph05)]EGW55988.1 flagellar hook-associated protein 3 [endosymbiont of Tevnia jerichonana (vent Tica)]USF88117.1 flagellar hook-associated protein FlgL [Candidatus Endoriftia persephone]
MSRMSTNLIFENGLNRMLETQSKLVKTQQQIATGRRVLSPQDDPAAAAYILGLRNTISTVEQYQDNSERVRARLELEETTLQGVTNLLPRIQELAVQGQNDALTAEQRNAIAEEVLLLRDQLFSLANTRDSNGEYIFAGFQGGSEPFVSVGAGSYSYRGDMGERSLQISNGRSIQDRNNGFDVFMNIDTSTGAKRNLFETVDQIAAGMQANNPDAVLIDDIQRAQDHLLQFRTSVGARLNSTSEQYEVNEDFLLTMQTAKSEAEDLDITEAVSRYERQLQALNAAQQSFIKLQGLSLFNFL